MKGKTKDIALVAVFTAVMIICSQISINIPISPVPITLSIFAVFLSTVLLGFKKGTLVQVVYVTLGICGAPVFNGFSGGFAKVFGPTGGYIVSYIIMALVMGYLIEKSKRPSKLKISAILTLGLLICYVFGTVWLSILLKMPFLNALKIGVLPYIPLDMIKIAVAAPLAQEVKVRLLKAKLIN
ncbi:MAG: biotin transporter BioY [Eubacteriales bacterium]|jgi:biotin transport system substrate-specific component|nr:biotin transporter BioY [Eubacteriales bacterium]